MVEEEAVGNRMSLEEGAGLDGGPRGRVMSVEVRELIEGGLVWEGTSGVAEWGMCGSRVEEGSGAAMGKVPRPSDMGNRQPNTKSMSRKI
jgi:hypothetical protein